MRPHPDRASARARLRDRLTELRRAVLRRRRLLAVLCTAGAVGAGVQAARPPEPPGASLLVAARDLPAGTTLADDDVRLTTVPPDAVPDGAVEAPAGALLAAPLRAGEPVTDVRLVGPGLAEGAPGTTAMPVRLSDADQAALLTVGDRIDVLATDPQTGSTDVVAPGALVAAVPEPAGAAADPLSGRLVVLLVDDDEVARISSAAASSLMTYAWEPR
ncbi:SAF domain-containing protein [Nocardioides sp. TF02-7]|uniref:SAF domain-containing protein n=1 Tax=Nocardioides sp. TF02-7 TaxID=2917724 RepID=UPI001F066C5C|nr:SAF domain-containing protein [Nocardioides sp. TF02-7]UMG93730.1 SAF domain-containing protein [Nocardioides sp. TF02-7]